VFVIATATDRKRGRMKAIVEAVCIAIGWAMVILSPILLTGWWLCKIFNNVTKMIWENDATN